MSIRTQKRRLSRALAALMATVLALPSVPGISLAAEEEESDEPAYTATVELGADEGETVSGYELITGSIESGDQVMIYYPNGGTAITGTANSTGKKLTAGDVTVADDIMETNNVGEVFTVYVDSDESLSFVTDDGEYLTCGSTGNSLSLATEASDYSLWTLEETGETGSYYIKSVNASYNGNAQYIEYYSGFTTYGMSSNTALYTYQLYSVGHVAVDDEEEGITSGTYVIWAEAYNMALSSTTVSSSSSYYAGVEVSEDTNGKMSGFGETELWTVTVNDDETLTLEQDGSYMGMNSSNYLTFGETSALDHYTWTVEDAGDGLYYLKDTTSGKYVEWYSSYSDWSTYYSIASGKEGMFALKFSPASKDDIEDTTEEEPIPTLGTVSSVKFTPNGGSVYIDGDAVEVALTTATEGATIYYAVSTSVDDEGNAVYDTDENGVIYDEYVLNADSTSPISLTKGFEQVSIMAYAEMEGYTTSAVTTRSFTERSQEEYNIYFGQLHSHTNYSDGAGTIVDAYEHATEVHETTDTLDFLAVTDHSNSFDNASSDSVTITDGSASEEWTEGNAYAEQYTTDEFVALFGYEMTWSNGLGHLNTFNTDGFQSRTQSAYTTYSTALQNYYDTLKTVTESISQFNHPGTTFGDFQDFSYYDEDIDDLITLIEVGNGEGAVGSSNYFPSYEYYTRALDKGWHVAPTNNQDNHKGLWGDSNTARTVVLADSLTEEDIYDAMRNYRVYATEDNDLSIYYTLDGNVMGSILSESDVDDTVTLSVKISDPTDEAIGTVSVIVNGGYVLASQEVSANEGTVTFEVGSDYSYYYIKVVEADGDIAVTAPVWVGSVEAVGVSTFETNDALAVQDEALNMTLSLYNNENSDFDIESIAVTVTDLDGNVTDITSDLVSTTGVPSVISSMDTADYSFAYTYSGLGTTIYTATITGTLDGVTKVYTEPLTVSYVSSSMVTNVVVDGSHYNDYVTGYYGGNMSELETIAAGMSIRMNTVTDVNDYYGDDSVLNDCSLLIISAPAKKSGTANAGDYVASLYEDDFIDAVAAYVQAGGNIIICGLADYGESSSSADYHAAAQQNKLLEAIGSSMSINDDEAYDTENNGGQAYRLYLETFNMDSEWLSGVVSTDEVSGGESYQVYSQYSGCTVNVGDGTWLVKGFDTTYSVDTDRDGVGATDDTSNGYNVVTTAGNAVFLACEDSGFGGTIFVSGGVFCSDFEVDADVDDYALPYANTTIITNILTAVQVEVPVTDIADVREAYGDGEGSGSIYKVRGYVTVGTANSDNAFFDCIYIQDETGGMDIFPYAEAGLELGTYVEVTGYLASYQGDIELKVMSYTILDDENLNVIDPTLVTCSEASDYSTNGGMLLKVEGTVKEGSIYYNSDGTLAQFTVVDETGEAVVFIDGYILSGTTGENTLADEITEGASVSAVGVLYMHPETLATDSSTYGEEVAVLRVRNCDEITFTDNDKDEGNTGDTENTDPDYTLGDVNQDGSIDYLDAMQVLRFDAELITLSDTQLLAGDVNGDDKVDYLDAMTILRYDAELIDSFS